MNKFIALCSSAILACSSFTTIAKTSSGEKLEPYVTYNQTYFNDNQIIDKYVGDLVAVKGKVLKIEKGPESKIIFQIKLDGLDKTLWVATIMNVLENAIKVGDHARILGFLDEPIAEPTHVYKITKDKAYLLGFCFHLDDSGLPIYYNPFMKLCVQWENGEPFKELKSNQAESQEQNTQSQANN